MTKEVGSAQGLGQVPSKRVGLSETLRRALMRSVKFLDDPRVAELEARIDRLCARLEAASSCLGVDSDGDVSLDWHHEGGALTISIAPDGRMHYAWRREVGLPHSGHGSLIADPAMHAILLPLARAEEEGPT